MPIKTKTLGLAAIFACIALVNATTAHAEDNKFLAEKRDLAGILGEIHYIRTTCNGNGDQYWRNFMRDFLALEASSDSRRASYVTAFNRGYRKQDKRVKGRCSAKLAKC